MKPSNLSSSPPPKNTFQLPPAFDQLQEAAEDWSAEELLRWASSEFGREMEVASAFGAEGVVLIDIASHVVSHLKIFILDTGYLFPQTNHLLSKIEQRYSVRVERVFPEISVQAQEEQYQPQLWNRDPDLCCDIRKIQPLRRKLAPLRAWVTAIRREQTATRRSARKLEWDDNFHLIKLNPLVDWTYEMVWSYIREHSLAYNPLHDLNYVSIGCMPCTRSIRAGEDQRAGRWPEFAKQECGLHARLVTKLSTIDSLHLEPKPE
jgi:phosphoadenosine phosphosulfate reductase